jgi:fructokinase
LSQLREITAFANAAAAFCVTIRGGIPAMPKRSDIEELLKRQRGEA